MMSHVERNAVIHGTKPFLKGNTMQAKSIQVGSIYNITLGRNEVQGEVVEATDKGWNVRLLASDKIIKVNSPDRFVRKARTIATTGDAPVEEQEAVAETEATPKKTKQLKEGFSALDAAHKVLVEIGTALNAKQITELVITKGYCPNLKGATPHATISSAVQREIAKDNGSRFYKAGKGLFGAVENQSE
jgi:ribosomal protein L18